MFRGKTAIVTGAGNVEQDLGIGATIALRLAKEECHVICVTRSEQNCARTAALIRDAGGSSTFCTADVSCATGCATLREFFSQNAEARKLDILVNVVHDASHCGLNKQSDESWTAAMHVNCSSLMYLAREFEPLFAPNSSLLNIGSIWANRALVVDGKQRQRHAYAAGKAAAAALVRTLAVEWASRGIQVNNLSLGYIKSPLVDRAICRAGCDSAKVHRLRDAMVPALQQLSTDAASNAAIALISEDSRAITGQDIAADGGSSVASGSLGAAQTFCPSCSTLAF